MNINLTMPNIHSTMYKTSVRRVVSLKFGYSYNIILRTRQTQDSKLLSQCVKVG